MGSFPPLLRPLLSFAPPAGWGAHQPVCRLGAPAHKAADVCSAHTPSEIPPVSCWLPGPGPVCLRAAEPAHSPAVCPAACGSGSARPGPPGDCRVHSPAVHPASNRRPGRGTAGLALLGAEACGQGFAETVIEQARWNAGQDLDLLGLL